MKISHEFSVERPLVKVWEAFQDIPSVAQCLPGATITEDKGDNVYEGAVEVKLGPMNARFEGEATVTPEPATHRGTITGKGIDRSGGSRGQVAVEYVLKAAGEHTVVEVDADIRLSGAVAQFGRTGLIQEISKRLIDELVECLHAKLDAETEEEAAQIEAADVKGISLFLSSLVSRLSALIKRLFGRS